MAGIEGFCSVRENVERLTGGNLAHNRDTTGDVLCELYPPALLWLTCNQTFLLKHGQVVINMAGAGNVQLATDLAVCRWHPFYFNIVVDELVYFSLYLTSLIQ